MTDTGHMISSSITLFSIFMMVYLSYGEHSRLSSDSEFELNNVVSSLNDLIENFTYVMDLQADKELYSITTSEFESILKLTTSEHGRRSLPVMSGLLHLTLLGAYKVHSHTIKDVLSKNEIFTLQHNKISSIAPWSSQLLKYLLEYKAMDINSPSMFTLTPLELAIKLQNYEAVQMMVQDGGIICESFTPLKCSNALHYAIINENESEVELVINTIKDEYLNYSSATGMNASLLQSLLFDTHAYDSTFLYSPLQISSLHCVTGLSCATYAYLNPYLTPDHHKLFLPPSILHSQTCSDYDVGINNDHNIIWSVSPTQTSGWKSYYGFNIGKMSRCDLPTISVHEDNFLQEFEHLFVDLG